MSFVLPEIVISKVITYGIKQLRSDKAAFYDLFGQFTQDELDSDYGIKYLDEVWLWFSTTKIPVVKAWSFNAQVIPCISIQLANETEDESKAAMSDYAGSFDDSGETGTGAFTVMVDIGIHANKVGDHVLWLYYIVAYCLFKHKMMAERLGIKLHTFSASDYNKEAGKMTENIWTRWVRFKGTTQNFWAGQPFTQVDEVNVDYTVGMDPSLVSGIAASEDVDIESIDTTVNHGVKASRINDPIGDEDINI
jgi:hypothetical protein